MPKTPALEALRTALPTIEWALVQNRTMKNAEVLRTVARALDAGYGTTEFTTDAEALIRRLSDDLPLCPPVGAAA